MSENEPQNPKPLEYRDPRDDLPPNGYAGQMVAGAFLSAVLLVGSIVVLTWIAFAMDYQGENQKSGVAGTTTSCCIGITLLTALLWIAVTLLAVLEAAWWFSERLYS